MTLKLSIYDEDGKHIARVAEGEYHELTMGVIIDIFDVLKMDEGKVRSIWEINLSLINCYKQVTDILHKQFPDITKEEWRRVKIKDIAKLLFDIVGYTLSEIDTIPKEKN